MLLGHTVQADRRVCSRNWGWMHPCRWSPHPPHPEVRDACTRVRPSVRSRSVAGSVRTSGFRKWLTSSDPHLHPEVPGPNIRVVWSRDEWPSWHFLQQIHLKCLHQNILVDDFICYSPKLISLFDLKLVIWSSSFSWKMMSHIINDGFICRLHYQILVFLNEPRKKNL